MADRRHQFMPFQPERDLTDQEITNDVLHRILPPGPWLSTLVAVLAVLFIVGIFAFAIRVVISGFANRAAWGYLAATLVFLLTTVQAAPLVAIGLYFLKADWRRQIARASQLFVLPGILSLLIYFPLLATLPPIRGRLTIWFDWPFGAPWLYDTVAMILLVLTGLAILYVSAIPDFATARDQPSISHRNLYDRLSLNWQGTRRQWTILRLGLVVLGALYMLVLPFIYWLIPTDFGTSLVPGWVSSMIPPFHLISGLQGAVAITIVGLFLLRNYGGLYPYIRSDHFYALSKILLALSLLWAYMWWGDFLTRWYGRTPREQSLLQLLDFGPYFVPWILAFTLSFVVPFLALVWDRVRKSILATTLVALGVLVGNFFNWVRLYVSAFSIEDVTARQLEVVPPTHFPDVFDILMIIGVLSGVGLLYVVTEKLVPPVAIWEVKEDSLLRLRRPFLKGEYTTVGKPQ